MSITLEVLAEGQGPLSAYQLQQIQQWINEDWEASDLERDLVKLIKRLLLTIKVNNGKQS